MQYYVKYGIIKVYIPNGVSTWHAIKQRKESAMPNNSTTVHDVTVHQKRKLTDEEIEALHLEQIAKESYFVKRAILLGTSLDALSVEPIDEFERFYEIHLSTRVFEKFERYCYAYVEARSGNNTAQVFVYVPPILGFPASYSAFWLYDNRVVQLVEGKTLDMVRRIFHSLMQ